MSNYYYGEAEVSNNGTTITGNSLSKRSNSNASSRLSVAEANNNIFKYIPARNRNYAKQLQELENTGRNMLNEEQRNLNAMKTNARKRRNMARILEDPVRMAEIKAAYVPNTSPNSETLRIQRLRAEERRKRKEAAANPKSGFVRSFWNSLTRKGLGGRRKIRKQKTRRIK